MYNINDLVRVKRVYIWDTNQSFRENKTSKLKDKVGMITYINESNLGKTYLVRFNNNEAASVFESDLDPMYVT